MSSPIDERPVLGFLVESIAHRDKIDCSEVEQSLLCIITDNFDWLVHNSRRNPSFRYRY